MSFGYSSDALFSDVKIPRVDEIISQTELSEEGVTIYVYGYGLVASVENFNINYYHSDRIGSNRLITSSSGSVENEFKALPFDQEIKNSGIKYSFATGKELDESDLYYFGARYYDQNLGRFISVDPVKENESYSYVRNNPLNFVDPTGMDEKNWAHKTVDFLFRNHPTKQKNFEEKAVDFLRIRGVERLKTTSYSLSAGHSGETIGIGYDIGQNTISEVKEDFSKLDITDQTKINIAIKYASDYRGTSISSGQLKLSEVVVIQINNHLTNKLVGYSNLNEKEKIVMISFVYQYGNTGATRRFSSYSLLDDLVGNPSTLSKRLNLGLLKMATLQYESRRKKEWNYAFESSKPSWFNRFMGEWREPFSESFIGSP